MQNTFPAIPTFVFSLLFYMIIKKVFGTSDEKDKLTEERTHEIMALHPRIHYYVNGFEIDRPISIFYKQYLGLHRNESISTRDITEAAILKQQQIEDYNSIFPVVELTDIKAARSFMFDQWKYMNGLN